REHLRQFSDLAQRPLYYMYADRFYLLLDGITLEDAQDHAENLRIALQGNDRKEYFVEGKRVTRGRIASSDRKLALPGVTVHTGVSTYPYLKLKQLLRRYPDDMAVAEVRKVIINAQDTSLKMGRREGGNCTIAWDPDTWWYRLSDPSKERK
ncbi:MAG: hypothetical protein M3Z24_07265, partial [Chloroflexota bacterium]|nr:hypothetical protein [Chloroflexota bacterium]